MSTFHGNARPHLLAGLESAQADHGADVSPARVRRPPVLTVGREAVTRLPGEIYLLDLLRRVKSGFRLVPRRVEVKLRG